MKHDDLWILRFYLSHKKVKQATECAKYTLNFRNEHKLDETDIRAIAPHQAQSGAIHEFLNCWKNDAMILTHPHPQGGVISFLKVSSTDMHTVVEVIPEDKWLYVFLYISEWTFQWLDYVSRTTVRLTKSVRFLDLNGFSFSAYNRECTRRDGKAMGLLEDCYPQLLQGLFAVNSPIIMDVVFNIVKLVVPKRALEKFNIINPHDREKDRKILFHHISENDLPDFLGGKNPIPPHGWQTHVVSKTSGDHVGKLSEC